MRKTYKRLLAVAPGLLLCGAVTGMAYWLEAAEIRWIGHAWLESLVLAIVLGSAVRTLLTLDERFEPGIRAAAKTLLEVAVVLLGASISARALLENGPLLIAGIALMVLVVIPASYLLGRHMGLPKKMAILIACGNAICGNSAIAAVAPVIDAESNDVAASIAFTAVLGVAVVLALPPLGAVLGFNPAQYGVFAGMIVYAVPQVLAATGSVSAASVHLGTVVKLVRVLMLGPVVLVLSLGRRGGKTPWPPLTQLLPWFIAGFMAMLALRSLDWIPHAALAPMQSAANGLTIMSMAALGLGVDARAVARAGGRGAAVAVGSLAGLGAASYCLIRLLGI